MSQDIEAATKAMKEQFAKLTENLKVPGVNIDALIESQRKNIEAMSKAAQLTAEGAAAISHRQLEILRVTNEQVRRARHEAVERAAGRIRPQSIRNGHRERTRAC
jgi:hypothetical protein